MRLITLLCTLLLTWVAPALANDSTVSGPVRASFVRAYDGNTITMHAYPWVSTSIETAVRVRGIDTPELNATCDSERALAQQAKEYTLALVSRAKDITLTSISADKYGGRVVANVLFDGQSLAELLIAKGYAKPYNGSGPKPLWCR